MTSDDGAPEDAGDYVEPDSDLDLSDADWKEVLLTVIDTNDGSVRIYDLKQAVMEHCNKDVDAAGKLISDASNEGYLQTNTDAEMTATNKLQGAVDAHRESS